MNVKTHVVIAAFGLTVFLACQQMSEVTQVPEAGINGSFEAVVDEKPVNWRIYSETTVPEGKFSIQVDTINAQEGNRSLKFFVHSCSEQGGRYSPGITQELSVEPGSVYELSFWIKNKNTEFKVMAGPVSETEGEMKEVFRSKEVFDVWTEQKLTTIIPEDYKTLRLEFSVLSPGEFRLDNVRLEKKPK